MRYALLVAAVCCAIIPINGQKTAPKTNSQQQNSNDTRTPESNTTTIGTVNVDKLNVAKQTDSSDKTSQNANQSPSYFDRLITPETLPNLILCLVGIAGVIAAICTFGAIKRQARIMAHQSIILRHQTKATAKAARAAADSVELQKTLKRQWLDLENWRIKGEGLPSDKKITLAVIFDVVNATDMPLTLKIAELFTTGQRCFSTLEYVLAPKGKYSLDFPIEFRGEQIALYFSNNLVINVFGFLSYIDAFGERKKQRMGQVCLGGPDGFTFSPFVNWLPSEEEEENEDPN